MKSPLPALKLPRPPYTPRDLQRRSFQELLIWARLGRTRTTLVATPGFGKSLLGTLFAGHLLTKGVSLLNGVHRIYKGAIIVVPTLQLIPSFTSIHSVKVPEGAGVHPHRPYLLDVSKLWVQNIEGSPESATEEEFCGVFRDGGLAILTADKLHSLWHLVPDDLSQFHMHLDEAHHAPLKTRQGAHLTEISYKRDGWEGRGGTALQASATPWHTESGMRIYEDHEPTSVVCLGDLRRAGLAPGKFEFHRKMLKYTAKTLKEFLLDTGPTPALTNTYKAIAEHWVDQGKPITIVRPPDRQHVPPLTKVFEAVGARVLDATGENFDRSELVTERNITKYKDRRYDVILACRRFDEGTDHPIVSNVYYIGAPSSVRLVIQLLGRALRVKAMLDYPKRWQDTAAFTMFIPRGDAPAREYLDVHMKDATLLAAYLADIEVGDRVITQLAPRLRESLVHGNSGPHLIARKAVADAILGDDVTKAEAENALDDVIAKTSRKRGSALNETDAKEVARALLSVKNPALRSKMIGLFADRIRPEFPEVAHGIEESFEKVVEDARLDATLDDQIHQAHLTLLDGFRKVMGKFAHLHMSIGLNTKMLHLVSKITGLQSEEIAAQVRRLCMTNPSPREINVTVNCHINRTKSYPTKSSGSTDLDGLPGYSWAQVAQNWATFRLGEDSLEDYGRMLMGLAPKRTKRRK